MSKMLGIVIIITITLFWLGGCSNTEQIAQPPSVSTPPMVQAETATPIIDESSKVINEDIIRKLIQNYETSLIEAINNNNFSLVEKYLIIDSELYKSQKQFVENLYNQQIRERLVDFEIKEIKKVNENSKYWVFVCEVIEINQPNKEAMQKQFNWIYTSEVQNGQLGLSKIEKWNFDYTIEQAYDLIANQYNNGSKDDLYGEEISKNTYVIRIAKDFGSGLLTNINAFLVVGGKVVDSLIDKDTGNTNDDFWKKVEKYRQ